MNGFIAFVRLVFYCRCLRGLFAAPARRRLYRERIDELAGGDPQVVYASRSLLSTSRYPRPLLFQTLLTSPHRTQRQEVMRVLNRWPLRRYEIPLAVEALRDPDPIVLRRILYQLGRMNRHALNPHLPALVAGARILFANSEESVCSPELLRCRSATVQLLRRLGTHRAMTLGFRKLDTAAQVSETEFDWIPQLAASEPDVSVPLILEIFSDLGSRETTLAVAIQAAAPLAQYAPRFVEPLIAAVRRRDGWPSVAAATVMRAAGDVAITRIASALRSGAPSQELLRLVQLAHAVGDSQLREPLREVLRAAASPATRLALHTACALVALGERDPVVLPPLRYAIAMSVWPLEIIAAATAVRMLAPTVRDGARDELEARLLRLPVERLEQCIPAIRSAIESHTR